jgi:hypothetical protein
MSVFLTVVRSASVEEAEIDVSAVQVGISRRSRYLEQVSCAIFAAEVYATPVAREVQVRFFEVVSSCVLLEQRTVVAERQAVIQGGFAFEENFGFAFDVEFVQAGGILVSITSVTFEIAAEIQFDLSLSGWGEDRKSGRRKQQFFHDVFLQKRVCRRVTALVDDVGPVDNFSPSCYSLEKPFPARSLGAI